MNFSLEMACVADLSAALFEIMWWNAESYGAANKHTAQRFDEGYGRRD